MSEAIPVLSLGRQVENIDQEHIDTLKDRLLEGTNGSATAEEAVQNVVNGAASLHAGIIAKGEFTRLQHKLGEDRLDDEQVTELEARLEEAFSGAPKTIDVATLPVKLERWGELPKLYLRIAKSQQVTKERYIAQTLIRNFLGPERAEVHWYARTKRITPVWLAASRTREELSQLKRLGVIVEKGIIGPEDERPLPSVTKLGKVTPHRTTRYFKD